MSILTDLSIDNYFARVLHTETPKYPYSATAKWYFYRAIDVHVTDNHY